MRKRREETRAREFKNDRQSENGNEFSLKGKRTFVDRIVFSEYDRFFAVRYKNIESKHTPSKYAEQASL